VQKVEKQHQFPNGHNESNGKTCHGLCSDSHVELMICEFSSDIHMQLSSTK
jgi:hypothetical protein